MSRSVRNAEVADREVSRYDAVDIDWIKTYVRNPIPAMRRLAAGAHQMGIPSGTHPFCPGEWARIQGPPHPPATPRGGGGWGETPPGGAPQGASALRAP